MRESRLTQAPRRRFRLVAIGAMLLLVSPTSAIDVSRDASTQRQSFEAWGTSLAWWANGVGGWSDTDARSDLIRTMFDQENGLGLNYARYNIGGGQNRRLAGNFRPGALVNGWVPTAPADVSDTSTWAWNWNADASQRGVLDEVLDLGVSRVDAISYSAPYWMTYSQDSGGGVNGAPNLPPEHYDELAHYQASVVEHFHDNLGVRFQAFSPLNEPDVNWWVAGGRQEGMAVPDGAPQRAVLQAVGQEFAARGLPIGLAAIEETNASKTVNSWQQLDATTKSYITHLHTHTYGNNSASDLAQIRNLAAADNQRLYMSEYGNNSSTGLLGGVALANRITADVNVMGANGWAYWQVVEPTSLSGAGWGLAWAGYSPGDSGHTLRKQFHVMRQFTHSIRPGSVILDVGDPNTVAAYDAGADTTTLVVTNSNGSPETRSFTLTDGAATFARVLQTTEGSDFVSLGARPTGATHTFDAPGPSVTTLVLHHEPNLIANAHLTDAGVAALTLDGGWRAAGAAEFAPAAGHGDPTTAAGQISASANAGGGRIWQEGIGEPGVDLTGQAFQLSLDAQFKQQGPQNFDAEAAITLEFYGADGETLTHSDPTAYATQIDPLTDDTAWRTFRSPVLMAPAGTRFVRPVISVANGQAVVASDLRVDNFYLQNHRHEPRGRKWVGPAFASADEDTNWEFDADRELHTSWYFGLDTGQPVTVAVGNSEPVSLLTIDSETTYRIGGVGEVELISGEEANAMIDVRAGSHRLQTAVRLSADAVFQSLEGAKLTVSGPVTGSDYDIVVQGAGTIEFTGALNLDGGELVVYAKPTATTVFGGGASLDGPLRVLLEPGVDPSDGDEFELVDFSAGMFTFDAVELPSLDSGLAWDLSYESSSLIARVAILGLPGDFNEDGVVDGSDYVVWRDGLGVTYTEADYDVWIANYGAELPPAGTSTLVPEPTGLALFAAALVGWWTRRSAG